MCLSQYSKVEFLEKFLKKYNVNNTIIGKFEKLPEKIVINGHIFDIYINATFFSVGDSSYEFELNYYSEELVEYLFSSKVFGDIEVSINYLLCELINNGYSKNDEV